LENPMQHLFIQAGLTINVNIPVNTQILRKVVCKGLLSPCTVKIEYWSTTIYIPEDDMDLSVHAYLVNKKDEINSKTRLEKYLEKPYEF